MADIQDIVDYYVDLLIIQYNDKPKARAHIDLIVREMLSSGILFDIQDAFNLETAIGVQLDILGKYIGVNRFYEDTDLSNDYFGFADAYDIGGTSSNIIGFDDAFDPDKEGDFLDAFQVISKEFRLNDDSYRFLLKLKIAQNYSNHSTKSISESMALFFGDEIVFKDNYNMTITYFIKDVSSALVKAALIKKVFPKPMGVRLEAINGIGFFGFADAFNSDYTPDYILGFNDAFDPNKEGRFLNAYRDIIAA